MFFEELAFYGALYLLVKKSTYSVSHKQSYVQNILFQLQTAMEKMLFFFFFSTNHGLFWFLFVNFVASAVLKGNFSWLEQS